MTAKARADAGVVDVEQVTRHCAECAPPADPAQVAQAAFVAGLLHGTVGNGGWTVLEADPQSGKFTVGLAALFEPGVVADVTVTVRQLEAH